jgi:hypothetical protein
MEAFRIPCLLRKSYPAERKGSDGELGAVNHPGILLPGKDAVVYLLDTRRRFS